MATVMKPTPTRRDAAPARLHLVGAEPTEARWSRRRMVVFVLVSSAALWAFVAVAVWLIT